LIALKPTIYLPKQLYLYVSLRRIPKALTIAGSDSGGGAGIQADLKTFSALGVYGTTVITSVTAQNTVGVTAIHDVPPEVVRAQIRAVLDDIGADAAKTGMLSDKGIISVVAEEMKRYGILLVVDPVMKAKTGASLLREDAVEALITELVPVAKVVTPNIPEAEVMAGMSIRSVEDAERAAERIASMGAEAVVVKGGHLPGGMAVDVLYTGGEFTRFEAERIDSKCTHGTGCTFSAALAAYLAMGFDVVEAVGRAKEFVRKAIMHGVEVGSGVGSVNPMAWLYNESERYKVVSELLKAVRVLESSPHAYKLVPETQMNLVMALPHASSTEDVAGFPGRIVRVWRSVKAVSCPEFGASRHVANAVLTAMKFNPEIRSAMNVRLSEELLRVCRKLGLAVSYYDRSEEPPEIREVEGATIPWGTRVAIERFGAVPDVIYHRGGWGKEPMATIFGRTPMEVVEKALSIASKLVEVQKAT